MTRLPLAQVTLCAVDKQTPALAAQSLLRFRHRIDFARVFLFTHVGLPTQRVGFVSHRLLGAITPAAHP